MTDKGSGTLETRARELAAGLAEPNRCPICHWTLASEAADGCVIGNCFYRSHVSFERELMAKRRAIFDTATQKVVTFGASVAREMIAGLRDEADYWKNRTGTLAGLQKAFLLEEMAARFESSPRYGVRKKSLK